MSTSRDTGSGTVDSRKYRDSRYFVAMCIELESGDRPIPGGKIPPPPHTHTLVGKRRKTVAWIRVKCTVGPSMEI